MIKRILFLGICGLVLAGIIHIVIILLIPALGSKDAARQIMDKAPSLTFQRMSKDSNALISSADPFFQTAVCRYDTGDNGVIVTADKANQFWSASVFNARGEVIYSVNDRTAIANKLSLLIVSPVQMAAIRQIQPDELETSIVVETNFREGFILLRALVREPSLQQESETFLSTASCSEFEPVQDQES